MNKEIVNEILNRIDPIGIAWFAPDEYDPEARDIAERLKDNTDTIQVVTDVFNQWFHPDCITHAQAVEIAEAIQHATKPLT